VGQMATHHGAPVKVLSIGTKRLGRGAAVPVITVQDRKGRVLTVRRRNLRRIASLPQVAQRGPAARVVRH
jgi:hypothetical protein